MKNLKNYYKKKMLTNKLSNSVEHQNIAKKSIEIKPVFNQLVYSNNTNYLKAQTPYPTQYIQTKMTYF